MGCMEDVLMAVFIEDLEEVRRNLTPGGDHIHGDRQADTLLDRPRGEPKRSGWHYEATSKCYDQSHEEGIVGPEGVQPARRLASSISAGVTRNPIRGS